MRKIFVKTLLLLFLSLAGMFCFQITAQAGLSENPYVTFSPDGKAFTINGDERDTQWYKKGYIVSTGQVSSVEDLKVGEHFYQTIKKEEVTVGKWEVAHRQAACIHNIYPAGDSYHGVFFGKSKCLKKYYSGWLPYCADCGQKILQTYVYMSEQAAAVTDKLDMSMAYYYRCPWCMNLEQAVELGQHVCKEISANQYSVRYHANFGQGYMQKSVHMYNNAASYEGKTVSPQRTLNLNSYTRQGYEFIGWNTEPDGTGAYFPDGAEILNLCEGEQDSITLYAQWKKCSSILVIYPEGGRYQGSLQSVSVPGEYGSTYELAIQDIETPAGVSVSFETNGGVKIPDIVTETAFVEWCFQSPMQGKVEGNTYYYLGPDNSVDYAKLVYRLKEITLPAASKQGFSFGGWYYDQECTLLAGAAGTQFLPQEDTKLYALWVDLQLSAADNYETNGGKGAVDLFWKQKDNGQKTYLLYQKKEEGEWMKIHSAADITTEKAVSKQLYFTGQKGRYTIPYSGYYQITIQGAQGGNYSDYSGGKGGQVTALLYFEKGEVLDYVIGGQNGYHGGGTGSMYGNGGGYTEVSTAEQGVLLIAGGGGGATVQGNGQPGGSALCTIAGNSGQNGTAGGGGGFRGGASGAVDIHTHTDQCNHVHKGSESTNGGCYTVPIVCGSTSFSRVKYKETFYYGNRDMNGNLIFCPRCGSYTCPGHKDSFYRYRCKACKKVYKSQPASCTAYTKYGLGCGVTGFVCGYTQGQIISSQPAYGGSSYVKTECCISYGETPGVKEGNGSIKIEGIHVGFVEENFLKGVNAPDCQAPERIYIDSVKILPVDERTVNISFDRPEDQGTTYYHKAESYDRSTNTKICTSNITENTLISGVAGYYYQVSEEPAYDVSKEDLWYSDSGPEPYISVTMKEAVQYLHVAGVDKAGNLAQTVHIPISEKEIIYWPVLTEQIMLEESESVYKLPGAKETYYVKGDGTTPFMVSYHSRLQGAARKDYQINQLGFVTKVISETGGEEGRLKVLVPMRNDIFAGSYSYESAEMHKQYENGFCLEEAAFTAVRSRDYCKRIHIVQAFTVSPDRDGQKIQLTPQAGILTEEIQILSDEKLDEENEIYLIPDGQGPAISGLEIPEMEIKENAAVWEYTIIVKAEDSGSGLKDFYLEILNTENGGRLLLEDEDQDGSILLQITSDNALFLGSFSVIAYAADQVGNETTESYGLTGIAVNAAVEKMRPPQSTIFKKGESGLLKIQAYGYVDRVEVIFPKNWSEINPALNRTFLYEEPGYMQTEEIQFMVPLQAKEEKTAIKVRAYKGEQMVEVEPELLTITVEGNILEEIRTRLR